MRALRIADLAAVMIDCLAPRYGLRPQDIAVNVIGSKPGEKLYEELLTEEESHRSLQLPNFYVILPAFRDLYGVEYAYEAARQGPNLPLARAAPAQPGGNRRLFARERPVAV